MASLTIGRSRVWLVVVALVVLTAAALLSTDAGASIVDYFRGGGVELLTP